MTILQICNDRHHVQHDGDTGKDEDPGKKDRPEIQPMERRLEYGLIECLAGRRQIALVDEGDQIEEGNDDGRQQ